MNSKTFFAAGLVAAAATALEVADKTPGYQPHNSPRISLTGAYYTSRPYYEEPKPTWYESDDDHVSTDDDKWSSSSSDSLSSSDEHPPTEEEFTCERDGDRFACLRKQTADQCRALTTFNKDTCLCEEDYICNDLKDHYGFSTCPRLNYGFTPYASPLENCGCQTQDERNAMYNYAFAGKCDHAPKFKKALPKVNKLNICNSDTDSASDCVEIGDLLRRVGGSYDNKQRDDNGNLDDSIYTDPNCDSRLSSCDTNSFEEFSNTDSDTVETESVSTIKKGPPIKGRLADRYAKIYKVKLPKKKHHGYDYDSCDDGHSCWTDTRTNHSSWYDGTETFASKIDSCDSDSKHCHSTK